MVRNSLSSPRMEDDNHKTNHCESTATVTAVTAATETDNKRSKIIESMKFIASLLFLLSSIYSTYSYNNNTNNDNRSSSLSSFFTRESIQNSIVSSFFFDHHNNDNIHRRRLLLNDNNNNDNKKNIPSYMNDLIKDLEDRKKLFENTPPDEVKYWFEYTGPLQKYFYRFSKSRGKADYFEGRDDSGVISSRFNEPGGGKEFSTFYNTPDLQISASDIPSYYKLLDYCFALGSTKRPDLKKGGLWFQWFSSRSNSNGSNSSSSNSNNTQRGGGGNKKDEVLDRCRVLITLNTVGAGRGSTMLWETQPPPIHASGPKPWISEQATAATHLERNLKEMDAMCKTGLISIRLQVLVCEPIPGVWTDYIDSMLPHCGGQAGPFEKVNGGYATDYDAEATSPYEKGTDVEDRASPVQVVVVASASTADTCHDLKSGFMEKRVQDLILAPPYLDKKYDGNQSVFDPNVKTTHPDLVSSDDYDLYIGMKWSSLVTIRAVSSFLQASADIAAAAASPLNDTPLSQENKDDISISVNNNSPSSPFLIPSFVRVSYVSEENNKVAKWRMHGDFFHPAAWEICKDSFDVTWIPDSLSGNGGVSGICYDKAHPTYTSLQRKLESEGEECGQWWIYMAEEQMSINPEIYANEVSPPIVQGGNNQFWMLTERHRKEVLKVKVCEHNAKNDAEMNKCGESPQAVIPLGDMESFLINFTPNTALGKKHTLGRRPGYSKAEEREKDRELVRERKQLKGQEDIEKALFDYTVYPAALFRKDATLKAARARDATLTKTEDMKENMIGPQTVKSSYYDVTIKKPREATLGWCQAIARKGLCALYSDYFRQTLDNRCMEACGLKKNWTPL